MRLATWNVHRCVGRDGRKHPERVGDVLEAMAPDLVALQEVELGQGADPGQLGALAERTGMRPVEGVTLTLPDGIRYGNAALVRGDVGRVRRHDLSVARCEPRGALELEVTIDGVALHVLATHLGLRWRERSAQLERLLGRALQLEEGDCACLVVLGDFNEWNPFSRGIRRLAAALGGTPHLRTFPTRGPVLALDRVWCPAVRKRWVHDTPEARAASDHLPLIAEL